MADLIQKTIGMPNGFTYKIVDTAIDKKKKKNIDIESSKLLYIYGCPSDLMMSCLENFRYKINAEFVVECCADGEEIENIFKSTPAVQFLNGHIYYNGVLLRALKIKEDDQTANFHLTSMKVYFERTTYAAIFALSGNYTEHPLLSEIAKSKMVRALIDDDKKRIKYLNQTAKPQPNDIKRPGLIENINSYLHDSVSAVQIGVSANIITNDDYLLFGKRDGLAIDGNKLYPSSNGNAEIADSNVEFYKYSATEDYPDIDINTNFRIDFNGEMTRETFAELNELLPDKNWYCYGLSLSGTISSKDLDNNSDSYDMTDRRLHFNALFEQTVSDNIYSIIKKQKKATESYENQEMIGVKLSFFKNAFSMFWAKMHRLLKSILSSKDVITTALSITVFVVAILNNKEQTIASWVTILFAIMVFSQSIIKVFSKLKKLPLYLKTKRYDIIRRQDKKNKVMNNILLGKEIHTVVAIIALCYVEKNVQRKDLSQRKSILGHAKT